MTTAALALAGEGAAAPISVVAGVVVAVTIVLLVGRETARAAAGGSPDLTVRALGAGAAAMIVVFAVVIFVQLTRIIE